MLEHVVVSDVAELVIHDGQDLLLGMSLDQCVEQHDFAERAEASHESV